MAKNERYLTYLAIAAGVILVLWMMFKPFHPVTQPIENKPQNPPIQQQPYHKPPPDIELIPQADAESPGFGVGPGLYGSGRYSQPFN